MPSLVIMLVTVIPDGRGGIVVLKSHSIELVSALGSGRFTLTEQFKINPLSANVCIQICEGQGEEECIATLMSTEMRKIANSL